MSKKELTDAVAAGLAGLAIALQVLLVALLVLALVALALPAGRRVLAGVRDTLLGGELWAAWVIAFAATVGSLFFSEYSDFIPCRLCWFQRIAMYPLAVLLLIAAIRRDVRGAFLYGLPLSIAGAGVAIYHLYIEANPEAESAGCKIGAPCATKWIDEFGYVTLPMLALTAFLTIAALLTLAWSRRQAARSEPALQ